MRNIDNIYVSIVCICHKFIDYNICSNNNQHSMLTVHKDNTVLQTNKRKEHCLNLC